MSYRPHKITFNCSNDQFELIHQALDKTRSTSESVRVDRQALVNLLLDHSYLVAAQENKAPLDLTQQKGQ